MPDLYKFEYCNACSDRGTEECALPSRTEVITEKIKAAPKLLAIGTYSLISFGRNPQFVLDQNRKVLEPQLQQMQEVGACVLKHQQATINQLFEEMKSQDSVETEPEAGN